MKTEIQGTDTFQQPYLPVHITNISLLKYLNSTMSNAYMGNRGWDGWMASLTQWTWVWVNSRSWWWTGKPGVPQSVGSQRVRHNWAAELKLNAYKLLWKAATTKNIVGLEAKHFLSSCYSSKNNVYCIAQAYYYIFSLINVFSKYAPWKTLQMWPRKGYCQR